MFLEISVELRRTAWSEGNARRLSVVSGGNAPRLETSDNGPVTLWAVTVAGVTPAPGAMAREPPPVMTAAGTLTLLTVIDPDGEPPTRVSVPLTPWPPVTWIAPASG